MLDKEPWSSPCHQRAHLFWIWEREAITMSYFHFQSSFYFGEKSENVKIHRNDSKRIGNPLIRMNYEFWRVLWSLFITEREGTPHSSFPSAALAVGIPLLNGVYQRWGGKPPPQRFSLASQSRGCLCWGHAPYPDRPRDGVRLVQFGGFMGGGSCHSSWLPCSSLFGSFWQN